MFPVNLLFPSSFCFSEETSPALPPKRKSVLVSSPTVNGPETGDESKDVPHPASEDNLPALPPKKSVSRMSAELNGPPVPEKPKVREANHNCAHLFVVVANKRKLALWLSKLLLSSLVFDVFVP